MLSQDNVYYKKYLKYKTKYLELKKSMEGGGIHRCKQCTCTDFVGKSFENRCNNTNGCRHMRSDHF